MCPSVTISSGGKRSRHNDWSWPPLRLARSRRTQVHTPSPHTPRHPTHPVTPSFLLFSHALHVLHHDQRLHSPQHHKARRAHWHSRNQSRRRVSSRAFFSARKRVPPPRMIYLSAATKSAARPLLPCQHHLPSSPAWTWSTSPCQAGLSPSPRARCVFLARKRCSAAVGC